MFCSSRGPNAATLLSKACVLIQKSSSTSIHSAIIFIYAATWPARIWLRRYHTGAHAKCKGDLQRYHARYVLNKDLGVTGSAKIAAFSIHSIGIFFFAWSHMPHPHMHHALLDTSKSHYTSEKVQCQVFCYFGRLSAWWVESCAVPKKQAPLSTHSACVLHIHSHDLFRSIWRNITQGRGQNAQTNCNTRKLETW